MARRFSHLIIDRPVPWLDVPAHHVQENHAASAVDVWASAAMIPGANASVAVRDFGALPSEVKANPSKYLPDPEPHRHQVDQLYVLVGPPGAFSLEVTLEDETYVVESPRLIYIPAGTLHSMRERSVDAHAKGYLVNVYLGGRYEALTPPK